MNWTLTPLEWEALSLSLKVATWATAASLPLGVLVAWVLARRRFPGHGILNGVVHLPLVLPPVVVGLLVYLMLSRSGPLGVFGLLYTPTAMIIAQVLLVTPIIAALTRQVVFDLWGEYREQLTSLGATPLRALPTLLIDGRYSLSTAVLAGFGRATAEVGAVMIVGGNIDHVTRVMTTAIALEVSKGDLALALALGVVLLMISITIGALAGIVKHRRERRVRT